LVGKAVLTGAGERLGEKSASFAKALWDRLKGRSQALDDVAPKVGAGGDALGAFRHHLAALLEEDPDLAEAISQILDEARDAGIVTAKDRSIAIAGDVSGSVLLTGDSNTVGMPGSGDDDS